MEIAAKYYPGDMKGATERLIATARDQGEKKVGDIDDITVLVLFINQ